MYRYRLIYTVTLATAILFYIAYSLWFSWYLLLLILLIAPLDLIISLPGMFTKSIKLSAPPFLEKGSDGVLTVSVINKKAYPVRCLCVRLSVLGDGFAEQCAVIVPTGSTNRTTVDIDTEMTGLTVFQTKRLRAVSLIGLFSVPIRERGKVSVLVLPAPEKPADSVDLPRGIILQPKPGGGFSEDHDMRGYRPGDPPRSVHWKLSAKLDTLIIREPLIPPCQSRLVHIMTWDSSEQRDDILSQLRWVSGYLLDRNMQFYVKFGDRTLIEEISSEEDLIDFLRMVLDNTTVMKTARLPRITRFSWTYKVTGN